MKGTFAFANNWITFSPLTGETTIEFIVSVVEVTCNRNHVFLNTCVTLYKSYIEKLIKYGGHFYFNWMYPHLGAPGPALQAHTTWTMVSAKYVQEQRI